MTDPFGAASFQEKVREQLVRICGDDAMHIGLAIDGPITREQILAVLAATPDGAGSQALYANLKTMLRRAHDAEPTR